MNSRSRPIVEMTQLSLWYFIGQPGQEQQRAYRGGQPEHERKTQHFHGGFLLGHIWAPNLFGIFAMERCAFRLYARAWRVKCLAKYRTNFREDSHSHRGFR